MRAIARRARRDLARLQTIPLADWPETVRKSRTCFRSRAFVLLLLEEARANVRSKPHRAAALAALVPIALDQGPGRDDAAWAYELRALGSAHHANSLRVAGDLPAADQIFSELRRRLTVRPLNSVAAQAEVTSLEASLRIDHGLFAEAAKLLDSAGLAYREAGDLVGLARTRIKLADLMWSKGRAADVLQLVSEATQHLAAAPQPVDLYLKLCATTWRVLALCELERFNEARELLHHNRDEYQASEDPHVAAAVLGLEGRIALGLGNHDAAEISFITSRDTNLALGRHHDAALASLDLAATFLAAGKITKLRELAASLLPLFQSRGAERETLASLRLLAEAVQAESLTTALLAELRRKLDTGLPSAGGASEHR